MPVQVRRGAPSWPRCCERHAGLPSRRRGGSSRWPHPFSSVPLSEQLGPCLPSKRAGCDSRAVLQDDVRWPGDAPRCGPDRHVRLPGWRSWQRRRLLIVSPQVRVLPLVPDTHAPSPSGTGAALRRQRLLVQIQPAAPIRSWSGTHLGSGAAVYRSRRVRFSSGPQRRTRGCVPQLSAEGARRDRVQCRFESGRSHHARVSQPAEDTGSDPVCCRCKSCPWHRRRHGRVAQRQCSRTISGRRGFDSPRAYSGILGRGTLSLKQRRDGSSPSPGTEVHGRGTTRA